jgi:hypothetical protein
VPTGLRLVPDINRAPKAELRRTSTQLSHAMARELRRRLHGPAVVPW